MVNFVPYGQGIANRYWVPGGGYRCCRKSRACQ